jgi:hypothetical protein
MPMRHGVQHQAEPINKDMALRALDFFAAVITMRVNRGPLFSHSSSYGYQ